MKYIRQFFIILLFCFLGEFLKYLIPLPIPTSIYGLILMLTALLTGILKVDQVDETAVFLIDIMPVMFIPAGVGLDQHRSTASESSRHYRDHDPHYGPRYGHHRNHCPVCYGT